ncbi:MAG: hypothetical protein M3123_04445, partial [Actinomycetota bacterium]|nr:hypothetical protein [Actinomycetota bacterium]
MYAAVNSKSSTISSMRAWARAGSRLKSKLNKPYYVFRPKQIVRRARFAVTRANLEGLEETILPWGLALGHQLSEENGLAI